MQYPWLAACQQTNSRSYVVLLVGICDLDAHLPKLRGSRVWDWRFDEYLDDAVNLETYVQLRIVEQNVVRRCSTSLK